ncbi:hypothetical protein Q7P35_009259 [Cladosporium inversicolor]
MPAEQNSRRDISHARRQPLHQRPESSNELRVWLRRHRHQFVRVIAVHQAIVVPTPITDEEHRKMGKTRDEAPKRESQLEHFRYRHTTRCDGLCACQEPFEHRVADTVVWNALTLELCDGSGESLGVFLLHSAKCKRCRVSVTTSDVVIDEN